MVCLSLSPCRKSRFFYLALQVTNIIKKAKYLYDNVTNFKKVKGILKDGYVRPIEALQASLNVRFLKNFKWNDKETTYLRVLNWLIA